MDIVMGSRKWQGDVPYLVEGNRNGPSVVQNVAERINKVNANPLDAAWCLFSLSQRLSRRLGSGITLWCCGD